MLFCIMNWSFYHMNKGKFASLILLGAFSAGVASSSTPGIAVKSEEKAALTKSSSNNKNIVKTNLVTDMVFKFVFSSCSIGVASGILIDILSSKRNERENGQSVNSNVTEDLENERKVKNLKDNGYNNNSDNNNVTEDLANEGKVKNLILLYFTGIFGIILSFVFFVKVIGPLLLKYKIIKTLNNIDLEDSEKKNLIENCLLNVKPELLKVLFSKESSESLKILIGQPALFKKFIEIVNGCYDEKALKCLLSTGSRELLKFLIDNRLGLNLWSGSNEKRKLLFSCNLMGEINSIVKDENLKTEIVKALFSIIGEVKKLSLILGEENKTLKAILDKENPLNIIKVLTSDTDSDSLKIFLENNGLEKCVPGKLDIVNALLKFKLGFLKKIVDNNNKLMNLIFNNYKKENFTLILAHLRLLNSEKAIALINNDIFEKKNAIKIIRFALFFKEDKFLEILGEGNNTEDFLNLNIDKFSDDVFKDDKKVVFKFIKDNNISLDNLLTFDLDAINFFLSKEFLLSEDGQINKDKKDMFIQIFGKKNLAEAFSKLNETAIKYLFAEQFDFIKSILEKDNVEEITNALAFLAMNNSSTIVYSLGTKENFRNFFFAIVFGKYGEKNEINLKVKTSRATHNNNGNKTEEYELTFKFGKNPLENVEELIKEIKKDGNIISADDFMVRLTDVSNAYHAWLQSQNNINNIKNSVNMYSD